MVKRVLIVEDQPEWREFCAKLVRRVVAGAEVVEAETLQSGLRAAERGSYLMALVDLRLPEGSGLAVVRRLVASGGCGLVVVVTVLADDQHVVSALSAGAQGYLLKDQPEDLLRRQLEQALEGVPALSPPLARRILDHFQRTGPRERPAATLTPREQEVLALIGRGQRIGEVARSLGVAEGTVASHVKSIYRKLGIGSRAQAAWEAARLGLLGA